MTPLLADFFKTRGFETALDLAEAERLKPPQPLPQFDARLEGEWQLAVRSAIPVPLESFFFGSALAGNIDIQALGNKPVPLAPNSSRKRTLHKTILAQSPPTGCCSWVFSSKQVCGHNGVYRE